MKVINIDPMNDRVRAYPRRLALPIGGNARSSSGQVRVGKPAIEEVLSGGCHVSGKYRALFVKQIVSLQRNQAHIGPGDVGGIYRVRFNEQI